MKTLSFVLLIIGTIGLLVFEFIEVSRSFTLVAAGFNVSGLILLICPSSCSCGNHKD